KWGRRLYDRLKALGFRSLYPVNPREECIGSDRCYPSVSSLPGKPDLVITVTRPEVTEKVAEECTSLGVPMLWMQPGSESAKAKTTCRKAGMMCSAGSCYVTDGLGESW
ncbi:MAG: CoA-binding protein, partial [Candidatus Aenigmatarchaeota archaeon]